MSTPSQFIDKNLKWIALSLLFLFSIKSIQSCNRKNALIIKETQYHNSIDSLHALNIQYLDSLHKLTIYWNTRVEIEVNKANYADQRAAAVQSAVEKLKSNTTIVVKNDDKQK